MAAKVAVSAPNPNAELGGENSIPERATDMDISSRCRWNNFRLQTWYAATDRVRWPVVFGLRLRSHTYHWR